MTSLRIGWREWLELPQLKIPAIKAKVDTGARTSALHADEIRPFVHDGVQYVRFFVRPLQRSSSKIVTCKARVIDYRSVRDSGGKAHPRYVVETTVKLGDEEWPIELTLASRDAMGFRMLLGRQAVRGRCLVDPGRSFLASHSPQPARSARKRKNAHKPSDRRTRPPA